MGSDNGNIYNDDGNENDKCDDGGNNIVEINSNNANNHLYPLLSKIHPYHYHYKTTVCCLEFRRIKSSAFMTNVENGQ